MTVPLPSPSNRLLRAATAEQADLDRHRERLTAERDKLVIELRRVDDSLAVVEQRLAMVTQLIDARGDGSAASLTPASAPAETSTAADGEESRVLLRGPAIREAAVRVLIAQPEHIEALHYRRWYQLLGEAGYAVAGKDPLAVFLTQLSRSPVVRKATQPGVYEVDRQAPLRIRQRLERLQVELREIALAPKVPVELSSVRARRHELDVAISQQERALEEALHVLRREDPGAPSLSAASTR
jgi:hypothetical protein